MRHHGVIKNLYGILGHPLDHTLSPKMQNAAFESFGISARYLAFDLNPKDFTQIGRNFKESPLSGFNVTVPFKEKIMPYLDQIDETARRTGAVNTVLRKGNRFFGKNTDVGGLLEDLKRLRLSLKGKSIVILGAGGASRACLTAFIEAGVSRICVINRNEARASRLVKEFSKFSGKTVITKAPMQTPFIREALQTCDLLVNATSLGLKAQDPTPIPLSAWPKRRFFVYDLIYNPSQTKLLKEAKKRKLRCSNGLGMLLYQGALAFEIWTGKKAPIAKMRKALENHV